MAPAAGSLSTSSFAARRITTLERVAASQTASATIFRANGDLDAADRAERFATRIRLTLDDPMKTERMFALTRALDDARDLAGMYGAAVEGAVALAQADFGNFQVFDARSNSLQLVADLGFASGFLDHFATVRGDGTACGRAVRDRRQTVIPDVACDSGFTPHRQIARAAGFRSVQSTPLVGLDGAMRAVVSTHYKVAGAPSRKRLALIEWYAELVGNALERRAARPQTLEEAVAATHIRLGARHEESAQRHLRARDALAMKGHDEAARRGLARAAAARQRAQLERERAAVLLSPRIP